MRLSSVMLFSFSSEMVIFTCGVFVLGRELSEGILLFRQELTFGSLVGFLAGYGKAALKPRGVAVEGLRVLQKTRRWKPGSSGCSRET